MGKKSSPAPDYTPVAQASQQASALSDQLARDQMAEARRQYEDQKAIAKPIVDAQLETMRQGISQGKDYYDYMVSRQRPIEDALQQQVLRDNSGQEAADRAAITDANNQYGQTVADIGGRQAESGRTYASGLREIMSQYGIGAGDLMSRLDARVAESDKMTRAALSQASGIGASIMGNSLKYEGDISKDIGLYTSGNDAIRAKYGTDIENDANLALADARAGQAQATNSAIRQAMRYGINVDAIAGNTSVANAQAQAAAANGARTASTDKYRTVVGQGIGMKQNLMSASNQAAIAAGQADLGAAGLSLQAAGQNNSSALARAGLGMDTLGTIANLGGNVLGAYKSADDQGFASQLASAGIKASTPQMARDMRISDEARGMAQKMDVAGMYRGLTGASAGAYGLAVGAGNSANSNGATAGNMLLGQMGQSAQMQMGGRQLAMQGLTNVLNNQTAYANANQGESFGSILGGLGGAAAGAAKLYSVFGSDRRLKFDITPVGTHEQTGLNLYAFRYIAEPARRFIGVMADEVRRVMPSAVIEDSSGFDKVDYGALGIPMMEI